MKLVAFATAISNPLSLPRPLALGSAWALAPGLACASALALALALVLHAPTAHALQEDTLEFDGRWKVSLQGPIGPARQAVVVLSNYGGRWQEKVTAASRRAACRANKPFPVTVQKSVTTELEFSVWSEAVSPGCGNLSITVAPQGPNKLQGTAADGHTVTMIRP